MWNLSLKCPKNPNTIKCVFNIHMMTAIQQHSISTFQHKQLLISFCNVLRQANCIFWSAEYQQYMDTATIANNRNVADRDRRPRLGNSTGMTLKSPLLNSTWNPFAFNPQFIKQNILQIPYWDGHSDNTSHNIYTCEVCMTWL